MISIDESRCTQCGLCVPICVRRILEEEGENIRVSDPALCIYCGHCKAICPTNAPIFSNLEESEFEDLSQVEKLPEPSNFLHFLRRRRSLRVYQNKPVEVEKLRIILEAGRFAPTGGNRQACEYIVVRGRKILEAVTTLTIQALQEEGKRIREALERERLTNEPLPEEYLSRQFYPPVWDRIAKKWAEGQDQLLHHAPALIVIHLKKGAASTPEVDSALASMQMVLMAETLGLGTCFIGFLVLAIEKSGQLRTTLKIPDDHQVPVAFTVGYSDVKFLRLVARNPARVKWLGEKDDA
jgi:nitroreductase/NAD-dependent dihydropyrimidine dehydrogenase PreA subunit